MTQLSFDADTARKLEAAYRTRDVVRRRRLVREGLSPKPGERILDVGCGLGFYLAELVDEVGPEGAVTGVDRSEDMLAYAEAKTQDLANASTVLGEARALPFADASFDAALSVQVLEYVDDLDSALAELHRVLQPGGRVALWDVDWHALAWHSDDRERMRAALAAWDAHLAHPDLPRVLAQRLVAAGFTRPAVTGHAGSATTWLDPDSYAAMRHAEPCFGRRTFHASRCPVDSFGADRAASLGYEEQSSKLDERGEFFVCDAGRGYLFDG